MEINNWFPEYLHSPSSNIIYPQTSRSNFTGYLVPYDHSQLMFRNNMFCFVLFWFFFSVLYSVIFSIRIGIETYKNIENIRNIGIEMYRNAWTSHYNQVSGKLAKKVIDPKANFRIMSLGCIYNQWKKRLIKEFCRQWFRVWVLCLH